MPVSQNDFRLSMNTAHLVAAVMHELDWLFPAPLCNVSSVPIHSLAPSTQCHLLCGPCRGAL
jgi:hypothetical protein